MRLVLFIIMLMLAAVALFDIAVFFGPPDAGQMTAEIGRDALRPYDLMAASNQTAETPLGYAVSPLLGGNYMDGPVYEAGIFGTVKNWLSTEVIAMIITVIVGIIAGALGALSGKLKKTFVEAGQFMTVLGAALEDNKISREELGHIVKEGKDVFRIWVGS